ncbi:tetratricopeptide repeat protein [Formosa sp. 4Alg 33]|uniref:tetratricopeptide repeat protein n=1 Tax=Formosa sp. 4Alg 33 TaxID=3382189 RepID=UPI003D9C5402
MKKTRTFLTFELKDKCYYICSFKENNKGELIILPRFAENYSEIQFGNPHSDEKIIDQHYTIHHVREGKDDVNVINHTLILKNNFKRNTRIYTRAFTKKMFCPLMTVRGQNFTNERYELIKNDNNKYIDIGEYLPNESTIYYMIIATSIDNKFEGNYNDLNFLNLRFENYSLVVLWSFGMIPSHFTSNYYHKLTQLEFKSQLEEGLEETEIVNQYRLDRQLQHSSFLSFLQKELSFNNADLVLINSLSFKKLPNTNLDKLDEDKIDINLGYYAFTLGNKACANGNHVEALKNFSESKKIFNKHNNQVARASVLNAEAILYHTVGKSQIAIKIYNQVLSIYQRINSSFNIANTYLNISMVYRDLFKNEKAKESILKTIEISNKNNFISLLASAYRELGIIFKNEDELILAEENLRIALTYFDKENNKEGKAFCLGNLGLVNFQKEYFKESLEYHSSSLLIFKEIGHQWGSANETANVGNLNCILGEEKGFGELKLALEMHKKNGYQYGIATDLKLIGIHHATKINFSEGMEYLEESRNLFSKIGNKYETESVMLLIKNIKANYNM